jgi:Glyoxalase/Bleomycin resistance protein/Dioxygenase superfamily
MKRSELRQPNNAEDRFAQLRPELAPGRTGASFRRLVAVLTLRPTMEGGPAEEGLRHRLDIQPVTALATVKPGMFDPGGLARFDAWAQGARVVATESLETAMANLTSTGIHHIKLPVSDLARSREWYERVLAYTVDRKFPDDDGIVRGVGGRLPGTDVPVALRQNAQAAAGSAGFDPVSFAIADRAAAGAWTAPLRRAQRPPFRDQACVSRLGCRRLRP